MLPPHLTHKIPLFRITTSRKFAFNYVCFHHLPKKGAGVCTFSSSQAGRCNRQALMLIAVDCRLATDGYLPPRRLPRDAMRVAIHALHKVDVVGALAVLEGGIHFLHRDAAIRKLGMAGAA